jgi:hypothetical protein
MIAAERVLWKHPDESVLFGLDFGNLLASAETLSSVTVTATPSGLTIGSPSVQSSAFTDEFTGAQVAANEGAKVRISGGTAGTDYTLKCTATTSGSNSLTAPAQPEELAEASRGTGKRTTRRSGGGGHCLGCAGPGNARGRPGAD